MVKKLFVLEALEALEAFPIISPHEKMHRKIAGIASKASKAPELKHWSGSPGMEAFGGLEALRIDRTHVDASGHATTSCAANPIPQKFTTPSLTLL